MSKIFENAVTSIKLGIEDFETGDDARMLSAARNYYAGLLLLAKQCLISAAPAADPMQIIGAKFKPIPDESGGVVHITQGYATVDLNQLKQRFNAFNLDWPKADIKKLQIFRNDLEHYHLKEPTSALSEAIASSFPMIIDFFGLLDEDPKEYLDEAWDLILEQHAAFDKVQNQCIASFDAIDWPTSISNLNRIGCPSCSSSLIRQSDPENTELTSINAECNQCGTSISAADFAERLVEAAFGTEAYITKKETGEDIISICPDCTVNSYVEINDVSACFNCEMSISAECTRCSANISVNDFNYEHPNLCSYCIYQYNKVMEE